MLVLDGPCPRGHGVRGCELQRGPLLAHRAVDTLRLPLDGAVPGRLTQVVEEQVDRRCRQGRRPVARRRVERDVDTAEAMLCELVLEHAPERGVEVRRHRVEWYVDDHGHATKV